MEKKKVLVIHDGSAFPADLVPSLAEMGYEVDVTAHVVEALLRMVMCRYDFLISEFVLPGVKGYGLEELLFVLDSKTRVLLVSANGVPAPFSKYTCLPKPVKLDAVVRALES